MLRTALLMMLIFLALGSLATYPYGLDTRDERNGFYYSSGGVGLLAIATVIMIIAGVL